MPEDHEILDDFIGDCVPHTLVEVADYVEMQPYLDGEWVRLEDVKANVLRAIKKEGS